MRTQQMKIGGMHCAACAASLEKNFNKAEGITKASVNIATAVSYTHLDVYKRQVENRTRSVTDTYLTSFVHKLVYII